MKNQTTRTNAVEYIAYDLNAKCDNLRGFLRNSESIKNKTMMESYSRSLIAANQEKVERIMMKRGDHTKDELVNIDNAAREAMITAERYLKKDAKKFGGMIVENSKKLLAEAVSRGDFADMASALRKGLYPAERYGSPEDTKLFATMLAKINEYMVGKHLESQKPTIELNHMISEWKEIADRYNMKESKERAEKITPIVLSPAERLLRI